jgi:hypothetical protein
MFLDPEEEGMEREGKERVRCESMRKAKRLK